MQDSEVDGREWDLRTQSSDFHNSENKCREFG